MSYDLAVFGLERSAAVGGDAYQAACSGEPLQCPRESVVTAFLEDLWTEHLDMDEASIEPDDTHSADTSRGEGWVILSFCWPSAERARANVLRLCRAYDLRCYDPQAFVWIA